MPDRKARKGERWRWRKEKEKGDGTRRRSAQPPITRCQRRQAVIRRLNSRSSRSVFVRVNLHQVSIFRAFRCEARRGEARWCKRGVNAAGVSAPKRRRAKSTVTASVINNTSKNNGENIGNGWPNGATVKDNSTRRLTCIEKYFNDKFSYELRAYRENECQLPRDRFIFHRYML